MSNEVDHEPEIRITSGDSQTWGELGHLSKQDKDQAELTWKAEGLITALKPDEFSRGMTGITEAFTQALQEDESGGSRFQLALEPMFLTDVVEPSAKPQLREWRVRVEPTTGKVTLGELKAISRKVQSQQGRGS